MPPKLTSSTLHTLTSPTSAKDLLPHKNTSTVPSISDLSNSIIPAREHNQFINSLFKSFSLAEAISLEQCHPLKQSQSQRPQYLLTLSASAISISSQSLLSLSVNVQFTSSFVINQVSSLLQPSSSDSSISSTTHTYVSRKIY